MQHLGSFARNLALEIQSELQLTRRQGRRVESIELTRNLREHGQQELAFDSRPFVLWTTRPSATGTLKYTRRNGRFVLGIVAHPDNWLDGVLEYGSPWQAGSLLDATGIKNKNRPQGPGRRPQPSWYQVSAIPELISGLETDFRVHGDLRQGQRGA
jgi:hypothetical protein